MESLGLLITSFVVVGILDVLAKKKEKSTRSLKKFIVRTPTSIAFIGAMGMAVWIGILIFGYMTGFENEQGKYIGDHPIVWGTTLIFGGMCFFAMLAPIKGVWDIVVDNDDITVVKAFVFKRHWKFSEITYGTVGRGGAKIYVRGRKRRAFFIDGMCDGYNNFIKRMDKEGKKFYLRKKLPE